MKKLNLSIVIPTRNRLKLLKKTLTHLKKNNFFFKEIIVVDSSDKEEKIRLSELKLTFVFKIINSTPGISKQRNEGLKNVNKNTKYVMFLDDDIVFEKNSIVKMYNFLKLNPKYAGVGFNLMIKKINKYVEGIKKYKLIKYLGIYDDKNGKVTPSGWQTKAINLKKNEYVDWLPTQAVIYSYQKIKHKKFDTKYGSYSYLEDLDFSYDLKNKGLIINSKAKYSSDNDVKRNPFFFGLKEIVNRYYFVKKFNLKISNFLIGCLFLILKHLILFFTFKPGYLIRIIGNLVGLIKIST
tara:strand:- start:744 stop:1628 length:885 start_codon:yes stop_codon:yes gene_type:complete